MLGNDMKNYDYEYNIALRYQESIIIRVRVSKGE